MWQSSRAAFGRGCDHAGAFRDAPEQPTGNPRLSGFGWRPRLVKSNIQTFFGAAPATISSEDGERAGWEMTQHQHRHTGTDTDKATEQDHTPVCGGFDALGMGFLSSFLPERKTEETPRSWSEITAQQGGWWNQDQDMGQANQDQDNQDMGLENVVRVENGEWVDAHSPEEHTEKVSFQQEWVNPLLLACLGPPGWVLAWLQPYLQEAEIVIKWRQVSVPCAWGPDLQVVDRAELYWSHGPGFIMNGELELATRLEGGVEYVSEVGAFIQMSTSDTTSELSGGIAAETGKGKANAGAKFGTTTKGATAMFSMDNVGLWDDGAGWGFTSPETTQTGWDSNLTEEWTIPLLGINIPDLSDWLVVVS